MNLKQFIFGITILCLFMLFQITQSGFLLYETVFDESSFMDRIDNIREDDSYVELHEINSLFLQGTIAVEDRRFYSHSGVDFISILRATLSNVRAGRIVSGGSTITQQLAKNLYLSFDKRWERKVAEVFIAYELESRLSKDEILELYVNIINYGEGQYGVKNASLHYYEKLPEDLTTDEALLLVGIPQRPSYFSLTDNYHHAVKRARVVVDAMIREDYLTVLEAECIKGFGYKENYENIVRSQKYREILWQ